MTIPLKVPSVRPLFSPENSWVHADSLVAGDTLITRDGTEVTVTANRLDLTPSQVEGQEFAEAHTYFAGASEVQHFRTPDDRFAGLCYHCWCRSQRLLQVFFDLQTTSLDEIQKTMRPTS